VAVMANNLTYKIKFMSIAFKIIVVF